MDGVVVLAHYNYTSLESQNLAFLLSLSLSRHLATQTGLLDRELCRQMWLI